MTDGLNQVSFVFRVYNAFVAGLGRSCQLWTLPNRSQSTTGTVAILALLVLVLAS